MSLAGARMLLLMMTLLWAMAALIAVSGPRLLSIAPGPPELRVSASPAAIPTSGSWLVTTCLHYLSNDTCVAVDTTITMAALLSDRSKFVQTKNTTQAQTTFSILAGTIGVRFDATYEDSTGIYRGFVNISGPTVVHDGMGWGLLLSSVVAASAFLTSATEDLLKIRTIGKRRRILVIAGSLGAVILPLAYVVAEMPTWFGTGWMPASFIGIPLWVLPITSAAISGPATAPYFRKIVDRVRRRKITCKGYLKK